MHSEENIAVDADDNDDEQNRRRTTSSAKHPLLPPSRAIKRDFLYIEQVETNIKFSYYY